MRSRVLRVLVGLPASGKTTYAQEVVEKYKENYIDNESYFHIDLDALMESAKRQGLSSDINSVLTSILKKLSCTNLILDGLFLSNSSIVKAINHCLENRTIDEIEVHYWEPNRARCLRNDKYRRALGSALTIKRVNIEPINLEYIKEETGFSNIRIYEHEIVRKPAYNIFGDKYKVELRKKRYLNSETWVTGGSTNDGYGSMQEEEVEEQPLTFVEFDDLLDEVCQKLSYTQYQELYNSSVEVIEEIGNDMDYYGSHTVISYYQCDLENLYNELVKQDLVDPSEFE